MAVLVKHFLTNLSTIFMFVYFDSLEKRCVCSFFLFVVCLFVLILNGCSFTNVSVRSLFHNFMLYLSLE